MLYDGTDWVNIGSLDQASGEVDLSAEFHTYGLLWSATELIYYFDGVELYRLAQNYCLTPSPIRLSTAVISWSGSMDDPNLDGSYMEVDYVRYYKPVVND
ncbi:MAG: glycoside hydrolase family 16 protein [Rikenellaceae bacterium]